MTQLQTDTQDIQTGVLAPRPSPYAGRYFLLRIENIADGRELVRRIIPYVASGNGGENPDEAATVNLAFSYQGLKALGVPQESLDSFPLEFQQGMAARAEEVLGDVGASSPANWEKPFGSSDVHIALNLIAPDAEKLAAATAAASEAIEDLPGISVIYRLDSQTLPSGREHFGYSDGIGQPLIEGIGQTEYPGQGAALKSSRLLLGYPDESGQMPPMPQPSVLGYNGTFMVFRKMHERVADFRRFLRANADTQEGEELLAAKMMGRWRSGAPLMLAPEHDDPALASDPQRNNNFTYAGDPLGLKCPLGAHIRRANPRDSLNNTFTDVTIHRCMRRGTSYGPELPEGVLEDDGVERGIVFIFLGSSIKRQFEFVVSQWQNDGDFVGLESEKDAIVGDNDGTGIFTIPQRPIRRRLQNIPRFTVVRGGEYCFVPSISALKWLAAPNG